LLRTLYPEEGGRSSSEKLVFIFDPKYGAHNFTATLITISEHEDEGRKFIQSVTRILDPDNGIRIFTRNVGNDLTS
jgi:hypothetical protein